MAISATLTATRSSTRPVFSAHVALAAGSDPLTDGRLVFDLSGDGATSHGVYLPQQVASTTSVDWSYVPPYAQRANTCTVKLYNGATLLATSSVLANVSTLWTGYAWLAGKCPAGQVTYPLAIVTAGAGSPPRRSWPARGAAFDILGSTTPVYVSDVRQGDTVDAQLLADDQADLDTLMAWLASGESLQVETAAADPLTAGTYWFGDATADTQPNSTVKLVAVPLVRVAEVRL